MIILISLEACIKNSSYINDTLVTNCQARWDFLQLLIQLLYVNVYHLELVPFLLILNTSIIAYADDIIMLISSKKNVFQELNDSSL